jgi:hypothetical protein
MVLSKCRKIPQSKTVSITLLNKMTFRWTKLRVMTIRQMTSSRTIDGYVSFGTLQSKKLIMVCHSAGCHSAKCRGTKEKKNFVF